MTITPVQRLHLLRLVVAWRIIAQPVGPMHAWWDCIFDVECLLSGGKPMLDEDADWYIQHMREGLLRWNRWRQDKLNDYLASPCAIAIDDWKAAMPAIAEEQRRWRNQSGE